jgi:hypothetical protein
MLFGAQRKIEKKTDMKLRTSRRFTIHPFSNIFETVIVLDHVSQVRDTVLMSVYLEVRNLGGVGILE